MLNRLLKLAVYWNEDKIVLTNNIYKHQVEEVSIYLNLSPYAALYYLRTLYLIINHLVDRKPIPASSFKRVEKKPFQKLLKLTNYLIKGKFQLRGYAKGEQFLLIRDLGKVLNLSSDRNAANYYRTLLELTWMITDKFKSEDQNEYLDYFS